jgi:hypothetical protein
MQRKDNSRTRRDRGLELELPAVEPVPRERSIPMESVSRARDADTVAPRRASDHPSAKGPVAAPPSRTVTIRRTLASRGGLRRALLLNEILGPPVALRDRSH